LFREIEIKKLNDRNGVLFYWKTLASVDCQNDKRYNDV
jgi:hypothetical protein